MRYASSTNRWPWRNDVSISVQQRSNILCIRRTSHTCLELTPRELTQLPPALVRYATNRGAEPGDLSETVNANAYAPMLKTERADSLD